MKKGGTMKEFWEKHMQPITIISFLIMAFIALILFSGCSTKTIIYKGDVEVMRFEHSSDAVVTYKDKEVEASVDNRGRPSLIEQLITAPFARQPVAVPK